MDIVFLNAFDLGDFSVLCSENVYFGFQILT